MSRTKRTAAKKHADDDDFIEDDVVVKKARKSTPKTKKSTETTPKKKKTGSDKLTTDDFKASDVNLNERLTEPLLALAKEEMNLGNKFKGISIKNAALMLQKYPHVIESGAEALKFKGIGKSIAQKIDDILANGAISKSVDNDDNQKKLANIEALSKVYGINHTLAASLVRDHNVIDIVDLVGKQDLLDQPARIGLKYFKDFQEPIPQKEVESILDLIRSQAVQIGEIEIREHGAYTRHESSINEIHVVVAADDKKHFSSLLDDLRQTGLITDTISSSETVVKTVCILPSISDTKPAVAQAAPTPKMFSIPKFSQIQPVASSAPNLFVERGHTEEKPQISDAAPTHPSENSSMPHRHLHRRLEFRYCTRQALPIVFTHVLGPASFFQNLQAAAQSKGYVLAAKTLREQADGAGKHVPIGSEQDLFEKLGVEFVKYEDRAKFVSSTNT